MPTDGERRALPAWARAWALRQPERALGDYREAVASFEALVTDFSTPEDRAELLASVNRLAPLLRSQGQLVEAEQLLDKMLHTQLQEFKTKTSPSRCYRRRPSHQVC